VSILEAEARQQSSVIKRFKAARPTDVTVSFKLKLQSNVLGICAIIGMVALRV
jgi:hypothetical protein